MKLKIEYVDINSIKPYLNNAKLHPEEQIEQIKKSIQEFGNNDPIAVWNNEIVEGHGRYEALKQLGETNIPIIRLDNLTDEERRAYTLVHNKLTMNSDFDYKILDAELEDIDIDMSEYGFDLNEFNEEFGTDFELKDGDREPIQTMNLTFSDDQVEVIKNAINEMKQTEKYKNYVGINQNSNGNALYLVVEEWLQQKM
jgi:ParB-like chromosome segregation protein Spo0J